ncbi:LrgB family protein [Pseudomonas sp. LS44]|uniref:LrgB family protein n=1 Tax=Pseudomonas sp. LS44 TaxID=1357074 RepID=UPI00215AD783|nr:LrgB family protein [Pseudomonas sp. LS44]UVE18461.1 LrgB family protein [Pseudomonas sp. LS44]
MSVDWHGAWLALIHHPLFGVGITLAAYQLALAGYEKTRWVFLQPVLVSMLLVIGILLACGIDYSEYRDRTVVLSLFLGPATVALAVPLFLNLKRIRLLLWPTLLTLLIGGLVATVLGVLLAWLLGADRQMIMSMAPKSVTSPIAMLVASQIGGIAALAAVFVLLTGVAGAVCGPTLLRLIGVRHPAAQGLALGITAHAVGTARAMEEGEECGGFAALGMSLMGVATAVLLPLAVALIV